MGRQGTHAFTVCGQTLTSPDPNADRSLNTAALRTVFRERRDSAWPAIAVAEEKECEEIRLGKLPCSDSCHLHPRTGPHPLRQTVVDKINAISYTTAQIWRSAVSSCRWFGLSPPFDQGRCQTFPFFSMIQGNYWPRVALGLVHPDQQVARCRGAGSFLADQRFIRNARPRPNAGASNVSQGEKHE